jgi:hypothetical protein
VCGEVEGKPEWSFYLFIKSKGREECREKGRKKGWDEKKERSKVRARCRRRDEGMEYWERTSLFILALWCL